MPNVKLKNYFHLHFLIFIAGFTAILGELISIGSIPLVWFRMLIAAVLMFVYMKLKGYKLNADGKSILRFSIAGVIIALHWITFFESINQANVSIALAMFSTGAFFASFIEPLFFKRHIIWYEIILGLVVIFGVWLITQSELHYLSGIIYGINSGLLMALFSVINGIFIKSHSAPVITLYEFISGVLCISLFLFLSDGGFSSKSFILSINDWIYILILASVCTAYAFIAAVHIMKQLSPYTVVLTYNLEPVYGILMALILFPEKEKMSTEFYIGAIIILTTVIINGVAKNYKTKKTNAMS
jgi:drug/metabolite transporter (DMT)-like permease